MIFELNSAVLKLSSWHTLWCRQASFRHQFPKPQQTHDKALWTIFHLIHFYKNTGCPLREKQMMKQVRKRQLIFSVHFPSYFMIYFKSRWTGSRRPKDHLSIQKCSFSKSCWEVVEKSIWKDVHCEQSGSHWGRIPHVLEKHCRLCYRKSHQDYAICWEHGVNWMLEIVCSKGKRIITVLRRAVT